MTAALRFPSPAQCCVSGAAPDIAGLRLRPARSADLPFLQRLYRLSRESELAAVPWPEAMKREFCRSQFLAQHQDYTSRYASAWFLIVEQGREPVGRLYVDLSASALHLIDIALLPSRQGRGLGSRILAGLQEQARKTGKDLRLSVLRTNHRAQSLYRQLGFTPDVEGGAHLSMVWSPE